MTKFFIKGFLLGISYVAPIGMQNLYVINSALVNKKIDAYKVALITIFFDVSLALTCFWGVGTIIQKFKVLRALVLIFGCVIVIYIGINLIKSKVSIQEGVTCDKDIIKIIISCFVVTWLNPQAIIDGSLLLAGFRVSLTCEQSYFFIFGSCIASIVWFTGLTTVISAFKKNFNTKLIRIINIICGIVLIYYGLNLGFNFAGLFCNMMKIRL